MKKIIDIPDDIRWKLQKIAAKEKKNLKVFIQDLLIKVANGKKGGENDN